MNRIFRGFCINCFGPGPLHYILSRSDFGFKFAGIFVFEKRLPAITDTGSQLLNFLKENSLYQWYGESTIEFFKRKLSVSLIRGVIGSLHQWYGESLTPRIVESENRQLRVSPIQRVSRRLLVSLSGSRWLRGSVIRGVAIQRKN